jgi:hypothetical protein
LHACTQKIGAGQSSGGILYIPGENTGRMSLMKFNFEVDVQGFNVGIFYTRRAGAGSLDINSLKNLILPKSFSFGINLAR